MISSESGEGLLRLSALLEWAQYQEEQQLLKEKSCLKLLNGGHYSSILGSILLFSGVFFYIFMDNCQN